MIAALSGFLRGRARGNDGLGLLAPRRKGTKSNELHCIVLLYEGEILLPSRLEANTEGRPRDTHWGKRAGSTAHLNHGDWSKRVVRVSRIGPSHSERRGKKERMAELDRKEIIRRDADCAILPLKGGKKKPNWCRAQKGSHGARPSRLK